MLGQVPLGDEVRNRIRFALHQLGVLNRHHEFEELCRQFANARLGGNFVPATGPVGAGGDQGRDFESYLRVSDGPDARRVVGICTTQQRKLLGKIRNDLAKIAGSAKLVYAFLTADVPVSQVHALEDEALDAYGMQLEVFDGNRLAALLSEPDLVEMAYRRLGLDARDLPAALRADEEYLAAVRASGLRHGWPYTGAIAPNNDFYQPQLLKGRDGQSQTWEQALAAGRHLVITGRSGAGKSTLLRHIATTLADRWLSGDPQQWSPVLLHARDLAERKPLVEALHIGATTAVGTSLHRGLNHDFFNRTLPSIRWLILVDGLDEVLEQVRANALDALLTAAAHPSMHVVVTSRPLHPRDQDKLSASFVEHSLAELDEAGLESFVAQWFAGSGSSSQHQAALALRSAIEQGTYNPLMASMICALASETNAGPMPSNRTEVYDAFVELLVSKLPEAAHPVIAAVQDRIMLLLKEVAFQGYVLSLEVDYLKLAVEWISERGIEVPPRMHRRWPETVCAVLLESGLMALDGADLVFAHPSLEEYFAARHMSDFSLDDIVATLLDAENKYFSSDDLLLGEREFIRFVMDHVGDDRLAAELVSAFPLATETLAEVIDDREHGQLTEGALRTLASDPDQYLETRAAAAKALDDWWPGEGVVHRLALSVDVDVDESDRLGIIDALVRQRGPVAAAIQWLTFENYEKYPDPAYHQQAIPRATFGTPSPEDKVAGLRLVVGAAELDDDYRVAACTALAEYEPDDAYHLFVSLQPTRLTVSYLANVGEGYAPTLLARLVQDDAQPFRIRLSACEEVECNSPEFALDLYEALAQSTALSPGQRDQVQDALEAL
ncbi:NACHT domain-containing NTPase [Lentzea sp. HUAS12]|uniref:NACHT domain-containing protein n=1 Tax=Lentzea sp. HUAS12 TaxID=2951806 RepID=UPI00209C830F|nr:NACHT domain-containing protein [Lentzea sp. HUAS12]USX56228.1 NACHT domain-containing protein [Lentzea sp. HUAS12]